MSRLLTLLLLYKNGYSVAKYMSIERQIEKTKDRYYDVLETSDIGWHEEKNDPIPFKGNGKYHRENFLWKKSGLQNNSRRRM